jgi:glucose-6-phosphate isomerase
MQPFATVLDWREGTISPADSVIVRRLSDMKTMYRDQAAMAQMLKASDPILYEVYEVHVPPEAGHLNHCCSIIYPGKVGDEYFMTKGHFHAVEGTAEIYVGLQGQGMLLMQTRDGQVAHIAFRPGVMAYIPPYWAHRMVNTGAERFIFLGVYPGNAGHNYGTIEQTGFTRLVVERDGAPVVIPNPQAR